MLPRLMFLGFLWFIAFCLTMAVRDLLMERHAARRVKRLRESRRDTHGLESAVKKESSSEERANRWKTGEPYQWEPESEDNGDDESEREE